MRFGAERRRAAAAAPALAPPSSLRSPAAQTQSEKAACSSPPAVARRKRRQRVAEVERQALGDHQRERDREAGDREPQRDGEAVAGGGADERHRGDRREGAGAGEDAERRGEADQRRDRGLPGGPGARRRVEPGKPASSAPVPIAPLVGAVQPELEQQRQPDRDRDQGAAAQRRPGLARPDREQRRGRRRLAAPAALKSSTPQVSRCRRRRGQTVSAYGQVLLAVAGAGVVLAGDAVVVAVEAIGVFLRTAVLEEEELGGSLAPEVGAVLVGGRGRRRQEQHRGDHQGGETDEKRLTQG